MSGGITLMSTAVLTRGARTRVKKNRVFVSSPMDESRTRHGSDDVDACILLFMITMLRRLDEKNERKLNFQKQGHVTSTEVDSFSVRLQIPSLLRSCPQELLSFPVPIVHENDLRRSNLSEKKSSKSLGRRRIMKLDEEVFLADSAEFGLGIAFPRDCVDGLHDALRSGGGDPYTKKVHAQSLLCSCDAPNPSCVPMVAHST